MQTKQIQVRVTLPEHLYLALETEARDTAVTMASLVRIAVKERYERQQQWPRGVKFGGAGGLASIAIGKQGVGVESE